MISFNIIHFNSQNINLACGNKDPEEKILECVKSSLFEINVIIKGQVSLPLVAVPSESDRKLLSSHCSTTEIQSRLICSKNGLLGLLLPLCPTVQQ